MGDGGAMFLGFLMATLGLKIRPDGAPFPAGWLVPVLILGVPIFDTTLVSISRARRGLLPFTSPGKDHTAHRLSNLGLGHRGAVLVLYLLAGVLGTMALFIGRFSTGTTYALVGALALCAPHRCVFPRNGPVREASKAAEILLAYLEEIPVIPDTGLPLWRASALGYTFSPVFQGARGTSAGACLASIDASQAPRAPSRNIGFAKHVQQLIF